MSRLYYIPIISLQVSSFVKNILWGRVQYIRPTEPYFSHRISKLKHYGSVIFVEKLWVPHFFSYNDHYKIMHNTWNSQKISPIHPNFNFCFESKHINGPICLRNASRVVTLKVNTTVNNLTLPYKLKPIQKMLLIRSLS